MFKTTTKDILQYVGFSVFGLAMMLLLMHMLGELHGLIVTVLIVMGQSAMLFMRLGIVQRELTTLRQERSSAAAAGPQS
jgi:hypothetical protein